MVVLFPRSSSILLSAVIGMLLVGGCKPREEIRHYSVPKEDALLKINGPDESEITAAGEADYRMLSAMIPRGEQAWFIRLLGPKDAVSAEADKFRAFVKSAHIADDEAQPEWTLPEGWRQQPGVGMRYATIAIDGAGDALDLSVMKLPRNDPDIDAYALSNLNRWRGQLGLRPSSLREMRDAVERVELPDGEALLFDLVGHKPKDTMSRAPFARGPAGPEPPQSPPGERGSAASSPRATGPSASSPSATGPAADVKYEAPQGWVASRAGGMRKAAFTISDGAQSAEVTVVAFAGSGGSLADNVNRWREQIGLDKIGAAEVEQAVQKIEVGKLAADYVKLTGAEKSILGVFLPTQGRIWSFKMVGSPPLVERETPRFEAFVRSVRIAEAKTP